MHSTCRRTLLALLTLTMLAATIQPAAAAPPAHAAPLADAGIGKPAGSQPVAPPPAAPGSPAPPPAPPRSPVRIAVLPAVTGMPAGIEPPADYVPQTACEPRFRPGTAALGRLLLKTYPKTRVVGQYACGIDGPISEHYDGRALDWMETARDPIQARQARAVLNWLLATDAAGNFFANARRIGVMYLIWNNSIWGTYDGLWHPYLDCAHQRKAVNDSLCHRNHLHISLSWAGAWGRTSFFSHRVFTATDYGPCRPADLTWAAPYTRPNYEPCPYYPPLAVPARASVKLRALIPVSGAVISAGAGGPPVSAVQLALNVPVTGLFRADTTRAVLTFKRAHHLPATSVMDARAWRALLAANHG